MENGKFLKNILGGPEKQNIYEKVMIITKRARQILKHRNEAFYEDLDTMGISNIHKEQLINTEGWQEILARTYEQKDAPVKAAQKEFEQNKITYNYIGETP